MPHRFDRTQKDNDGIYYISRKQLKEGIHLCFKKAQNLIRTSDFLFKENQNMNVILGITTLALEEYGKGLLLKDRFKKPRKIYGIPKQLFGRGKGSKNAHRIKMARALIELPEHYRRFYPAVLVKFNTDTRVKKIKVSPNEEQIIIPAGVTGIFELGELLDDVVYVEGNPNSDFQNDFVADLTARLRSFYVDWDDDNKVWRWGVSVSKKNMVSLISKIKEKIDLSIKTSTVK